MYKGVTHFKRLVDCEREISEFYTVCRENLKEKLAYVLFQMPPSFSYSEDRLSMILESLDYSFNNVVEFRNASWWRSEVYEAFKQKSIVFCNVSYPKLPEEIVVTAPTGYIRLHGVPKLFYSGYSEEHLELLIKEILATNWKEAFVYFNNTASENVILNALNFKEL